MLAPLLLKVHYVPPPNGSEIPGSGLSKVHSKVLDILRKDLGNGSNLADLHQKKNKNSPMGVPDLPRKVKVKGLIKDYDRR